MSVINLIRRRSRSGQAMALALAAIAFLIAIAGAASLMMLVYSRMARHEQDRTVSFYLARSGLEKGMLLLVRDEREVDTLSDIWNLSDTPDEHRLQTGVYGMGSASRHENKTKPAIVDEERKLNINLATPEMLKKIMPGVGEDRIREIDERRSAEEFTTVSEFLEEAGLIYEAHAGNSHNTSWHDLLTVHGSGKININTAPSAILMSVEGISEDMAARIVDYRAGQSGIEGTDDDRPIQSLDQARDILGFDDEAWSQIVPWIDVRSSHFTIRSWGKSDAGMGSAANLWCVVKRAETTVQIIEWAEY